MLSCCKDIDAITFYLFAEEWTQIVMILAAAVILLAAEFFVPMRRLGSAFNMAMSGLAASDRLFEILDIPEEEQGSADLNAYLSPSKNEAPAGRASASSGASAKRPAEGSAAAMSYRDYEEPRFLGHSNLTIQMSDVHFSYEKNREILHGIDIILPPGGFIALVGPSGCGKTTVAEILTGRRRGYKGMIRFSGPDLQNRTELREISEKELLRHVVLVRRNSYIFKGTIEENLRIAKPDASPLEMLAALEAVHLLPFIRSQKGLATEVEEQGKNLSGGQAQCLALARMLLMDTEVLIFDEATSALDVSVGAQILNLFQEIHDRKDFAMLFISHNLNVVYYLCNRIAVMYRGSIVEQGDAESLYNAPLHPYTRTLLSAIPEIDAGDELSRYAYQETRREPAPDGCDFYHRCPYATDQCKKRPELTDALAAENGTDASEKEREHLVRCWNPVRSD